MADDDDNFDDFESPRGNVHVATLKLDDDDEESSDLSIVSSLEAKAASDASVKPQLVQAYVCAANSSLVSNDTQRALQLLNKAHALDDSNADVLYGLSRAYHVVCV